MANAEHTASLPPIIEDESDENLLPMFYQKELERKDYRSHEKNSPSNKRDFSEQINETQLPYNSWKAKNRMLNRNGENGISPDMVSRLGQSLENCHSIVPGRSQEVYQSANHPHTKYIQDNSVQQAHNFFNHTEQDFGNPSNIEIKRYHTHQEMSKTPQMFDSNFIQNSMPGIYANGYPGFLLNSNKNMISPNGNSPFHGSSPINNSYRHYDVSSASVKLHSSPRSSCNPHSPNPGFHHENHRLEKVPCQKNCCRGSFPSQNACMDGLMSTDGPHLNYASNANYESPGSSHHNSKQQKNNCNCCHGQETKSQKKDKRTDKNITKQINDLYRIVYLQNQQLIQLQNDFKKLIEYNIKNEDRNQKLSEQEHSTKKQSKSTMEKRMFNLHVIEENKNLMEKVSVGIMTSFIDTTSVKKKKKDRDSKKKKEIEPPQNSSSESGTSSSVELSSDEKERAIMQRKIQKKTGSKKKKSGRNIEDSILLNGIDIPAFVENTPSPNGSLNIEMQDYASSSDSDSSDVSDSAEEKPAPVGWTFYDKVVGKVNNMLNDSESETEESSSEENEIRNKTLEQLRKLGVSIEESPTKRVTFNEVAYIPQQQKLFLGESDTSMKMNALAMKYLQEDKVALDSTSPKSVGTGGLTNNTNLSVATLRYLEKYHLPMVTSSPEVKSEKPKKKKEKKKEEKKTSKKKSKTSDHSGKILDITAIKQQPKLLPKT